MINAAGVYADAVMHQAGVRPEFRITPRRGEYYVIDRNQFQMNSVLFPVPTKVSKGILVTTTVHGNTIVGPNAEEIGDPEDTAVTAAGMQEIWDGARKLVPSLSQRAIIAVFAGLRPGTNAPSPNPAVDYNKDFVIEVSNEVQGLVNLAGIESPGLTAAPAIAERVVELLRDAGEPLAEKDAMGPGASRSPRVPPPDTVRTGRPGRAGTELRAGHLPLRDGDGGRDRRRDPRADPRRYLRRDQAPDVVGHRALPGGLRHAPRG